MTVELDIDELIATLTDLQNVLYRIVYLQSKKTKNLKQKAYERTYQPSNWSFWMFYNVDPDPTNILDFYKDRENSKMPGGLCFRKMNQLFFI